MVSDSSAALEYSEREKALIWKQDLRVVPLAAFIYLLCYLDRSNIGKSALGLCSGNAKQLYDALKLTLQRQCQNFKCKYAQRLGLRDRGHFISVYVRRISTTASCHKLIN